ncbi:uncharacterized protein LOC141617214 [Silene latifolia]|uniref:uncharacterized protein LOC141617214 n=1 Tax=Silene latifolia TaxID=37657 RepID=UPI003D77FE07
MPFRYLGIPITCGRMKKSDCTILVEKLIDKVRSFGSRKLSYLWQVILVNSVLSSIYSYWANIFIIPKGVLNKINAICRNYLWDGNVEYIRVPMVSWDKSCSPKAEGGLGIRESYAWNLATVGKLVWWIYCCPDRLWVRWISNVYLKGCSWTDYTPLGDISWGWKTVCKARDKLAAGFTNGQWVLGNKGYTVNSGYELLRQKYQEVHWHKEALQLKDRLFTLGIASDDICFLCGAAAENFEHLFQTCVYSSRVMFEVARLYEFFIPPRNVVQWVGDCKLSQLKEGMILCLIHAAHYHIWLQRNKARVDDCILRPEAVLKFIKKDSVLWLKTKIGPCIDRRDQAWDEEEDKDEPDFRLSRDDPPELETEDNEIEGINDELEHSSKDKKKKTKV